MRTVVTSTSTFAGTVNSISMALYPRQATLLVGYASDFSTTVFYLMRVTTTLTRFSRETTLGGRYTCLHGYISTERVRKTETAYVFLPLLCRYCIPHTVVGGQDAVNA